MHEIYEKIKIKKEKKKTTREINSVRLKPYVLHGIQSNWLIHGVYHPVSHEGHLIIIIIGTFAHLTKTASLCVYTGYTKFHQNITKTYITIIHGLVHR